MHLERQTNAIGEYEYVEVSDNPWQAGAEATNAEATNAQQVTDDSDGM